MRYRTKKEAECANPETRNETCPFCGEPKLYERKIEQWPKGDWSVWYSSDACQCSEARQQRSVTQKLGEEITTSVAQALRRCYRRRHETR